MKLRTIYRETKVEWMKLGINSMFWNIRIKKQKTSSQDGGVGRYTVPPHTTKRTTKNLKTKINQNCQKIELYGSPTTKELRNIHLDQ